MATQDARDNVLCCYGEVMYVVQYWELALAIIWWRVTRRKKGRPAGDFDTASSQREIRKLESAFQRVTAQEARQAVSPQLGSATAEGLEDLMAERNRLAHRFLREQQLDTTEFKAGTVNELVGLGQRFEESCDSLMRTINSFDEYTGPVLPHWPEVAKRILDLVQSGEQLPRDPKAQ